MRTTFDFAPFRRSSVGFDRLFDMLENSTIGPNTETYPPFDLVKLDDNRFRIALAVAGFGQDDIEITAHENVLIIRGRKGEEDEANYIHRGIATRSFERRFALADHVQVRGADLKDGLLLVEVVREIPEAMKPRRIAIGGGAAKDQPTLEAKAEKQEEQAAA
jgi:molecular chaperone IbpA